MTNFTEFTSYSPNYVPAKIEFLEWLQERARERGYDPKLDRNNQILFERSFTVIRTRGSLRQSSPFKFKVNDEVNTELPNFENAYSVVLDLHSATEFDPDIDDFYPMPLVYYQTRTNEDKNGDYPISIYLGKPRLERCRNSVDVLFPSEGDEGTGFDQGDVRDQMSDKTRDLNQIFRDISEEG
ncbi:hypothetical protein B2G88_18535 [Natronolimnobius baerhuensis]|uniref:Uncharacterized protein n=2 Tax=Natronolimnobius baerhuensis TaxID=253108 RepID=A0A202E407_9EURY|nr:hypothetical protein B2G88_18535 [Natronolimnobius baerhuensis]